MRRGWDGLDVPRIALPFFVVETVHRAIAHAPHAAKAVTGAHADACAKKGATVSTVDMQQQGGLTPWRQARGWMEP